ncbi:MAG: hypothetical protein QXD46_08640 [Thermofilum sp.]
MCRGAEGRRWGTEGLGGGAGGGLRCFRVWGWMREVERPWGVRGIGGVLAAELGDGFGYARGIRDSS